MSFHNIQTEKGAYLSSNTEPGNDVITMFIVSLVWGKNKEFTILLALQYYRTSPEKFNHNITRITY